MPGFWPISDRQPVVSPAKPDDLQQCADIHAASFVTGWGDGEIAAMLSAKNTHCLVAKSGRLKSHVVGFLIYRISAKEAEILTIAVQHKHRGLGVGAKLLEEMIRHCLADRLEEVFLEVDAANRQAISLYQKEGFKKVGERKGYYKQPPSLSASEPNAADALIMRLDLAE